MNLEETESAELVSMSICHTHRGKKMIFFPQLHKS